MQRKIYKPKIDGFRSLPIIAVIINHFNKEGALILKNLWLEELPKILN